MHVVYAKYTTWVNAATQIVEGEAWRADDPIVKAHPEKFGELPKIIRTTLPRHLRAESPVEQPVEQATAAPGEKRVTRTRKKKSEPTRQPAGEPEATAESVTEGTDSE